MPLPSAPPLPGALVGAAAAHAGFLARGHPLVNERGKLMLIGTPFGRAVLYLRTAEQAQAGSALRCAAAAEVVHLDDYEIGDAALPLVLVTRVVAINSEEAKAPGAVEAVRKEWGFQRGRDAVADGTAPVPVAHSHAYKPVFLRRALERLRPAAATRRRAR